MKGSKVGLADLKRLKKDLEAERQRATLAAPRPRPPRRVRQSRRRCRGATAQPAVRHIKRDARVEPPAPPAPRQRAGRDPTRADAGVSDGGEVIHLLSEGGTAFVRDAAPTRRATCVAASGARAPNSTCTACA